MLEGWIAAVTDMGEKEELETSAAPALQPQNAANKEDDESEEEAELAAAQAGRIGMLRRQRQQLQQVRTLFRASLLFFDPLRHCHATA